MSWVGRSLGGRSAPARNRARGVAAAAFLALLLQAFVVQTHVHTGGLAPAASLSHAIDTHSAIEHADSGITAHQPLCAVCVAVAASGRALLSAAAMLAPPALATLDGALPPIRAPPRAITHAWRSRAPPIDL